MTFWTNMRFTSRHQAILMGMRHFRRSALKRPWASAILALALCGGALAQVELIDGRHRPDPKPKPAAEKPPPHLGRITGWVLDDGKVHGGAYVVVKRSGTTWKNAVRRITPNPRGRYLIKDLQPGAYDLRVLLPSRKAALQTRTMTRSIELEAGHTVTLSFRFVRAPGEIRGVVSVDGRPVKGARVNIKVVEAGREDPISTVTDRDGVYSMTPLAEGYADVKVTYGDHVRLLNRYVSGLRPTQVHVNFAEGESQERVSALYSAAKGRTVKDVEALMRLGLDPNDVEPGRPTPLYAAVDRRDLAMTVLLLEHGADMNADTGRGGTPLIRASELGALKIVRELLRSGADPNRGGAPSGTDALTAAASSKTGDVRIVRALVEAGAKIEADNNRALQYSVFVNKPHPEIVQYLLAKGADPDTETRLGQTVLDHAIAQGKPVIARILIAHGARRSFQIHWPAVYLVSILLALIPLPWYFLRLQYVSYLKNENEEGSTYFEINRYTRGIRRRCQTFPNRPPTREFIYHGQTVPISTTFVKGSPGEFYRHWNYPYRVFSVFTLHRRFCIVALFFMGLFILFWPLGDIIQVPVSILVPVYQQQNIAMASLPAIVGFGLSQLIVLLVIFRLKAVLSQRISASVLSALTLLGATGCGLLVLMYAAALGP